MLKWNDCSRVRLSCSQSLDSINHCQFVNQYYRQLTNIAYHLSKAPSQQASVMSHPILPSQPRCLNHVYIFSEFSFSLHHCLPLAGCWMDRITGKPSRKTGSHHFSSEETPHMARNRRRDGRSLLWMAVSLGLNPYVCPLPKVCHECGCCNLTLAIINIRKLSS